MWAVGLPLGLVLAAVAIEYFVYNRLLPPGYAAVASAATLLIGVAVFARSIWGLLERAEQRLRQAYAAERSQRQQLVALQEATLDLTSELNPAEVMQKVVDKSCEVIGARYGALATLNEDQQIDALFTHGIDPATRARMGPPPTGHGVLGTVTKMRSALRLDDLRTHPDSVGFPENHPLMTTLLAVPVMAKGRVLGNLYLAEKLGGQKFTAQDEEVLERFAAQTAVAVSNARLYDQLERLSVVAERERIAMDLHDGVIQSLYAVRLQLESTLDAVPPESPAFRATDRVIDELGEITADIRHYVFDLRSQLAAVEGFPALLRQLLASLQADAVFTTHLELRGDCGALERSVQWELWHIAREALSNAVRHSGGNQLDVFLECDAHRVTLSIRDNGQGFEPGVSPVGDHNGLANMRQRAETLSADLSIHSAPGQGTEVRVVVPVNAPREAESEAGGLMSR